MVWYVLSLHDHFLHKFSFSLWCFLWDPKQRQCM